MANTIYAPINPIEGLNELKIHVAYDKGSFNYFDYTTNKRGIYVHFKPVERHDGMVRTLLLSDTASAGFKTFVVPLGRKSAKLEDTIFAQVEKHASEFAQLYNERQFQTIVNRTHEIVRGVINGK